MMDETVGPLMPSRMCSATGADFSHPPDAVTRALTEQMTGDPDDPPSESQVYA